MYNIDTINVYPTRYDMAKFMPFEDSMYDILNSKFMRDINILPIYGIYTVTVEEANPPLIAERIYGFGNTQFWWIIMIFNQLIDETQIVAGLQLKYPYLASLETEYFSLNPRNNGNL